MKRIAIIGAGPVGLEAALYARRLGLKPTVYEKGQVGESVERWGHVTMFSPWRMNVSPLAASELSERGWSPPDPESCPTGRELRRRFLLPLAGALGEAVSTETEVVGVTRSGLLKGDSIGGDRRSSRPFRLLLRRPSGRESSGEADFVLDASGVFGNPGPLGDGGLPAPGERELREDIDYGLPDILGRERARYAGRTVLLAGAGHSAATCLLALERLSQEEPGTSVHWAYRSDTDRPLPEFAGDPLPARSALGREANRLAAGLSGNVRVLRGMTVDSLEAGKHRSLRVSLTGPDDRREVLEVERIIAATGFRPDLNLSRELQAHHCYATEGAMRLAARLLGAGQDCLKMPAVGPDAHRHPEPGFFAVGQKSYGRNPAFLLANGRAGVRDVFRIVLGDPGLDLYGEEG